MKSPKPPRGKKALIRAWLEREKPALFGEEQAAAVRRELHRALGPGGQAGDRYLRETVEEWGVEVAAELGGIPRDLLAMIHLETLFDAEIALQRLEERRLASADRASRDVLIRAARRAREKSSLVARNSRVNPRLRAQWEEIAQWFVVWLQNPELFANWLELRKMSPEFRARFAL